MGAPSLVKEGLSWKDIRLRALHTAPVELRPLADGSSRSSSAVAKIKV
jgi:phosphatidylinositol alpha-mannosyltransferase